MIKIILLILLAELWGTAGQVLYKKGADKAGTPNLRDARSCIGFVRRIVATPSIWLGLGLTTVGLGIWLTALAQADLSLAFPIDSMQYIVTLIAARAFLGERISPMKLFGTLLIIGGIAFVAFS